MDSLNSKRRKHVDVPQIDPHTLDDISSITIDTSRIEVIDLAREVFTFIADYQSPIPGASRIECGNYREHDFGQCRQYAQKMCGVLQNWSEEWLTCLS